VKNLKISNRDVSQSQSSLCSLLYNIAACVRNVHPQSMHVCSKQIWGTVADFIPTSADYLRKKERARELLKFLHLPKLLQKDCVGVFWLTVYMLHTFLNGEMKLVRHTMPPSANSLATSAIRLIFSSRSSGLKPRFLLRPWRMLSPSRLYAGMPWPTKYDSSANEIVVLPAPDKPDTACKHIINSDMETSCTINLRTRSSAIT